MSMGPGMQVHNRVCEDFARQSTHSDRNASIKNLAKMSDNRKLTGLPALLKFPNLLLNTPRYLTIESN
jgi:hypothetical protein